MLELSLADRIIFDRNGIKFVVQNREGLVWNDGVRDTLFERSSVRDVLLEGVLHSEGNASTPGGCNPTGGLKGEKRNVDQICSFGMFVGGGGNCGTGNGLLSQKKCLSSC